MLIQELGGGLTLELSGGGAVRLERVLRPQLTCRKQLKPRPPIALA